MKLGRGKLMRTMWGFCLVLSLAGLLGCGNAAKNQPGEYRAPASGVVEPLPHAEGGGMNLAPVWEGLRERLARDGVSGPQVDSLLADLSPVPTQSPMGRKIAELYQKAFYPKPKQTTSQKYYKGVVTPANAKLCRQFVAEHEDAFSSAWRRYGVPSNVAVALLFVETRLGKVLGDVPENAFYTLASMAVSTRPEDISQWLPRLKGYQEHLVWLDETMRKRANWAFNETKALIMHMMKDGVPPQRLPGSIYGAVGLCQFMPSNISVYGADGDNDGRVDLFTVPDAVASLSYYLARHGWKPGLSQAAQHKVLMTYNHSKVYANTILALADMVAKNGTAK